MQAAGSRPRTRPTHSRQRYFLTDLLQSCRLVKASKVAFMADVMQILSHIELGDPAAAENLLPQACDELRKVAPNQLAYEKPDKGFDAKAP